MSESEHPDVKWVGRSPFVNLATGESVHPPYADTSKVTPLELSAEGIAALHVRFTHDYRTEAVWYMDRRESARLNRVRRHYFLVFNHGQPPKNRRTKRGSKRLL